MKKTIAAIKSWMQSNGAPRLVENLSKGASAAAIAKIEKAAGVKFPPALCDLYRLHDGQPEEGDCFIESLNFLSVDAAFDERKTLLLRYIRGPYGVLDYGKEWKDAPLEEREISERWWPIAVMDGDMVVMNLDSGRVFWAHKDVPPLTLAANDLPSFFETYLSRLEAGVYRLDEGFGEYYLASNEPWPVPALPRARAARARAARVRETPEMIVERIFKEVLGRNLFFLFDEVTGSEGELGVALVFHTPRAWAKRLHAHPVVKEPIARFKAALRDAFPGHTCAIELRPVEVSESSLRVYLKQSGPAGAELLREID